jgi:isopentenyldiphosphate isomerase
MTSEIWDILNENGFVTGRTTVRGIGALKPGEYHLVVHIWVISDSGKILIQKRSQNKKLMPGEWAATGGAAISGEDSFKAASRELFEELSITSSPETLNKIFRLKRRNSLLDVWTIKCNTPVSELKLQESEVADAKWVSVPELKNMVKKGEFHNYGKEYFDKLFTTITRLQGVTV